MPRGLGAPGFQLRDREKKEKEKHKDRERDDEADYAPLLHSKSEVTDREKEFEGRTRPRSLHRLHLHRDNSQKVVERDLVSISSDGTPHDHNHTQYGWSSMLEEWYTHANAPHTNPTSTSLSNDVLSPKPTLLNVPVADERDRRSEEVVLSPKAQSTGDLNARMSIAASDRGPYELLIKERMMGLYLAIFVHRDVRPLVEGLFSHIDALKSRQWELQVLPSLQLPPVSLVEDWATKAVSELVSRSQALLYSLSTHTWQVSEVSLLCGCALNRCRVHSARRENTSPTGKLSQDQGTLCNVSLTDSAPYEYI